MTPTLDTLRAELRRMAEAATPGPWYWGGTECESAQHALQICRENIQATGETIPHFMEVWDDRDKRTAIVGNGPTGYQNASYIATANPSTILALLDHIDALESERTCLQSVMAAKMESIHAFVGGQKVSAINPTIELSAEASSELVEVKAERDALAAVVERQREFLAQVAKQIAEKPDYWSSCGQCERNSSDAEDLIELTPATALRLHDAGVLGRLEKKLREAGAELPVEVKGTIESSMKTGLSVALSVVLQEMARLRAGGEG